MWSGPRNISTAMMRAWENRGDCQVVDEPFYAHYLHTTALDHPMRREVLQSQSRSSTDVIEELLAPLPAGIDCQYQKHMAQHMIGGVETDWYAQVRHAFLIRNPAEMIASYSEKRELTGAADLGLAQQVKIYSLVQNLSERAPPVVDAKDVLDNPEGLLKALCAALDVPFTERMCRWPAGRRNSDGVWAAHWYNAVEKSTRFAPYRKKEFSLDDGQKRVLDDCLADYDFFSQRKLRVTD